jgi:hypothetical protein
MIRVISMGSWTDLDCDGEDIVILQEGVLDILVPIRMGFVLSGDKIDHEFITRGQFFNVDKLAG